MAKRKDPSKLTAKYRARLDRLAGTGETPYDRRKRLGLAKGRTIGQSVGHTEKGFLPIQIQKGATLRDRHFLERINQIGSRNLRDKVFKLYNQAKKDKFVRSKAKQSSHTPMDRLLWVLSNYDNPRIWRGTSGADQQDFNVYLNQIMDMIGNYAGTLEDEELDDIINTMSASDNPDMSLYQAMREDGTLPDRRKPVKMKKRKTK